MSLIIVSIFVLSSVSTFNTSTKAQEEFVDSITIEVVTNKTAALDEVANGDLDVFLNPVSGEFYENINESWKEKMGTWGSIGRYNTMLFNPAHTVSPYECNVSGEYQFNPFAIKEIRQAQNFLLNRQQILNEIYGGYAEPRYLCVDQNSPGYQHYFQQIVDEYGYTPSGNKEKGIQMIQDAMEDAMNSSELEGELRKGEDDYWEYRSPTGSWEDIELTGLIGSTDPSTAISENQADLLEECGYKVDIRYRQSGINYLSDTDPSDLKWHFYPGSWHPSGARYYQENLATIMYAGWMGYMPGGMVPDADYRYGYEIDGNFYGNRTLERITKELYNGQLNDTDEYWNKMVKTAELGLDQAVRIFLVTEYNFYPYDKDRIYHASTDVLTGWSDVFTPRTMRTEDGNLTVAQYSSQNVLYRESWNELGGSDDINGQREKKMVMDEGSVLNPSNGRPIPMRTDWQDEEGYPMIEKDYEWKNGTLQKGIDVPSDAVIYNSSSNQWKEIGEDKRSAIKVTYKVVGGKWHSGADLTLRDVMGWHAWSWDMAFEDDVDDPYYHREFGRKKRSFFNNIVGEKWDEDNQTYTIWGDYTFPADSKIGHYYSIWPAVPYYQYQAAQFLVNQDDEYIPNGTGTYSWNEHEADHWIDWLSEDQGENITETLQNMIDKDYTPWFMKDENNAPITVLQDELNDEMQHLIDFYNEHNHIFASNGPFLLDNYDHENQRMQMVRFTQKDGYPWPEDKWSPTLYELMITDSEVPDVVQYSDPLNVSFDVKIRQYYPGGDRRNVTKEDNATGKIEIWDLSSKVAEMKLSFKNSTFYGSFDTSELDTRKYSVRFVGSVPDQIGTARTKFKTVVIRSWPPGIEVSNFDVDPLEVEPGNSVSITATVENTGTNDETIDITANEEVIESFDVPAGETVDIEKIKSFDEEGTYEIKIANKTKEIIVGSPNLSVKSLGLQYPEKPIIGDEITILADIENTGTIGLEDSVFIDGEAVRDFTLKAGESQDIVITYTFDSAGKHTIRIGDETAEIDILNAIVIEEVSLSDDKIKKGNKVEITARIINNDDNEHEVDVEIDGEAVKTWTVQSGIENYSYEHKFDEKGTYEVTVGDQPAKEVKVEGKDTPGFALTVLLVSISLTTLYRYRKKITKNK